MFQYFKEREKNKKYQKLFPEMAKFAELEWEDCAGFSIPEIIPKIETMFKDIYGIECQIQCRAVLKENSLRKVMKNLKFYHLSLEYYGTIKGLNITLQPDIIRDKKPHHYAVDPNGNVNLTPMNAEEKRKKENDDIRMQQLITNGDILFITSEERDLDLEEIVLPQNWQSKKMSLEKRQIETAKFKNAIINCIIEYIEARQNEVSKIEKQVNPK